MASEPMDLGEDWQSKKTVTECNRHMLDNQISCDVRFIVGQEQEVIPAHKYVLVSRSTVFFTMLSGPFTEHTDSAITIPDIPPDIFKMLLRYLYCDEARLDLNNVLAVLYAAKKYGVQSLIDRCLRKLNTNIVPSNVCVVMENAHIFGENELKQRALELILRRPEEVFVSESLPELCSECLEEILKNDKLPIEESKVFDAILYYSSEKCKADGLEATPENRKTVLGGALKCVRFPLLSQEYFIDKVEPADLLSQQETLQLYRFYAKPGSSLEGFNSKKRQSRLTVSRFEELGSGWGYKRDNKDAISFTCSHDILFHGVQVYGCNQGSGNYEMMLSLKQDPYMAEVARKSLVLETDGGQKVYDVVFDKPPAISKNKKYTIVLVMKGPTSYFGVKGVAQVSLDGVDFTFETTTQSSNNTTPERGQIPSIIFELE